MGSYTPELPDKCNGLCAAQENCCDRRASCMCGTHMGLYECMCRIGFYGNGLQGGCQPCPAGTYKNETSPGDVTTCMPCPDENQITAPGATSRDQCQCKKGFQSFNNSGCAALRCPKLTPPKNGYFVNEKCSNVFNAACGMRCNPGYERRGSSLRICQETGEYSGTATECIMKSCPPLPIPKNGNMICSRDDFSFDTVCRFTCDTGYKLVGSRKRTCLAIAFWTGITTRCREITCQPLPHIRDGNIYPAMCTKGEVPFGTTCQPSCHSGYSLIGPPTKQCLPEGTWSPMTDGETSQCVDTTAPIIRCPKVLKVIADEDEDTGEAIWDIPIAVDNSGYIPEVTSFPNALPPKRFPIGDSVITYSAEDLSGNRAECNFTVIVIDIEPPRVDRCFSPLPIVSPEPYTRVTWDAPEFSDNSDDEVKVERSHAPGLFPTGKTEVLYTAWDSSGNNGTCVIEINVIPHPCEYPSVPPNGNRTCYETPEGIHCRFTCMKGYAFALPPAQEYFCAFDNVWQPEDKMPIPDCSVRSISNDIIQPASLIFSGSVSCRQQRLLTEIEEDVQNKVGERVTELCEKRLTCRIDHFETTCEEEDDFNKVKIVLGRQKRGLRKTPFNLPKAKTSAKNPDALLTFDFKLEGTVHKTGNQSRDRKLQGKLTANLKRILHTIREEGSLGLFDVDAMHFANMSFDAETTNFRCRPGSVLMGTSCVSCPIGTFFNVISRNCESCLLGTYQPQTGQVTCLVCPQNTSTTQNQSKTELECKAQCLPGTFSPDGLEICETCPIGQYLDSYAQTSCLECPEQTTTNRRGSRTKRKCKEKCAAGYVSKTGLKPCFACPKGTYQSELGMSACFECPGHGETTKFAATSLTDCADWEIQGDAPRDGQQQVEFNECFDVECHNGGSCVFQPFGFKCICATGYTGITCDLEINECDALPCLNGGTCVDLLGDYTCICMPGFTDKKCGINIDECVDQPCLNGATCVDGNNEYHCQCAGGFQGKKCETASDGCNSEPCRHGGSCVEAPDGYQCFCARGITGVNCEIDVDECAQQPCRNGGSCVNLVGSYECRCLTGTSGFHCEIDINECESSPCLGGATCYDRPGSYLCKCQPGFSGKKCEKELDINYMLDFPTAGTADYSKVTMEHDLSAFTVAFWMKSNDRNNYGTPVSYAAPSGSDNALTITDYNGFVIYVNGEKRVTDVEANNGEWHHIVVTWSSNRGTWKIYLDGGLQDSGFDLASSQIVDGGGTLVVGQEQDANGAFSSLESFVGELTQMNLWNEELPLSDIDNMRISCEKFAGNVVAWPDIQSGLKGSVVSNPINMCKDCPNPEDPLYGEAHFTSVAPGSFVTYSCTRGFILAGRKKRQCLVTGEWEGYSKPTCQRVDCGYPGGIANGFVEGRGYTFDNRVRYVCEKGYKRRGPRTRYCNEQGEWEGEEPRCEEIKCVLPSLSANTVVLSPLTRFSPGVTVHFECTEGNIMYTTHRTVTCQSDGTWDRSVPTCDPQTCTKPPDIANAAPSVNQPEYSVGFQLRYECDYGYIFPENSLNPKGEVQCLPSGKWESGNLPFCQLIECHEPKAVTYAEMSFTGVTFLSTTTYTCNTGYYMQGEELLECLESGKWEPEPPVCRPVSCGRPEEILHGTVRVTRVTFNSVASYSCELGYRLIGVAERTCLANTSWSGTLPACKPISCGKPEEIEHGQIAGRSYILGSIVEYSCDEGFRLSGISERRCREDARWHGDLPSCLQIECDPPPSIDHGYYSGSSFYYGESIVYECNEGFVLGGNNLLRCQSNGEWSPAVPSCSAQECFNPEGIRYGSVTTNGLTYNSKAEYVCDDGYELEGDSVRICQSDGSWSGLSPRCIAMKCTPPTGIHNGRIDYKDLVVGSIIRYFCNSGFTLNGDEVRRCLHSLTWEGSEPQCRPVLCQEPDDITNGIKIVTGVIFGSVVTYVCDIGYNLVGESQRTCTAEAIWSGDNPNCVPVICSNPTRVISNGRMFGEDFTYESQIRYECDVGYNLVGSTIRTCLDSGEWDVPIPVCDIVHCPRLRLSRGSMSTFKTEFGTSVTLACNKGYSMVGQAERMCLANGTWSGETTSCMKIECAQPGILSNGKIQVSGTVASYSCNIGYTLVGSSRRECQADGTWDSVEPSCDPVACPDLSETSFSHGRIVSTGAFYGSYVDYVCNEGYTIIGESRHWCSASGEWGGIEPSCSQIVCPSPPNLNFGKWVGTDYSFNSTLHFACDEGYRLTAASEITCLSSGVWSSGSVHCEMVTCPQPVPIAFGTIGGLSNTVGSKIVYSCLLGFELIGDDTRTCEQSGAWSGLEPSCTRLQCPVPEPLENGKIIGSTYTLGSSIRYACFRGYELRGLQSRFCLTNKEWTGISPRCNKVKCPTPEPIRYGNIIGDDFEFEGTIRYSCNEGYVLQGEEVQTCLYSRKWSGQQPSCDQISCGQPQAVPNSEYKLLNNSVTYGAIAQFSCFEGYTKLGHNTQTCASDGFWTEMNLVCSLIECNPITSIEHGNIIGSGFSFGDTLEFTCDTGYTLIGETILHCESSGWTSSEFPHCEIVTCPEPVTFENGLIGGTDYTYGSEITFSCSEKYQITFESKQTCSAEGQWIGDIPTCQLITCRFPPEVSGGQVLKTSHQYSMGDSIEYSCKDGFYIVGSNTLICSKLGIWEGTVPTCQRVECPILEAIPNGRVDASVYSYESTATYYCDVGYDLKGSSTRTCLKNGVWSQSIPSCSAVSCPSPANIENGHVKGDGFSYGDVIVYHCDVGYELLGAGVHTCDASGQWSEHIPSCRLVNCAAPPDIKNGIATGNSYNYNDIVYYTCSEGFELIGNNLLQCASTGLWDGSLPGCQPITCGPPPVIPRATTTVSKLTYGSIASYECNDGYALTGRSTALCSGTGTWDYDPSIECLPVDCGHPRTIPHGRSSVTGTSYQSVATYICDDGYYTKEETVVTCGTRGSWEGDVPTCLPVDCGQPPTSLNVIVDYTTSTVGQTAVYSCPPGYTLVGTSTQTCMVIGSWSGDTPQCLRVTCPPIQLPDHTLLKGGDPSININYNDKLEFLCEDGYKLEGERTLVCQASGSWSAAPPICALDGNVIFCPEGLFSCDNGECINLRPDQVCDGHLDCSDMSDELRCGSTCDIPDVPANSVLLNGDSLGRFYVNSSLKFGCEPGYLLVGNSLLRCTSSGKWNSEPPVCLPQSQELKTSCGKPRITDMINVIRVQGWSYRVGDRVTYKCRPGVPPATNPPIITCLATGEWSGQIACAVGCKRPCMNQGMCIGMNRCKCRSGYGGSRCERPICILPCLNNGKCSHPYMCSCPPGYEGIRCQKAICHEECQNGGRCTRPNRCECYNGFKPPFCRERTKTIPLPWPVPAEAASTR